jgi:phospholipase C
VTRRSRLVSVAAAAVAICALGAAAPRGGQAHAAAPPIQHIVVLMQENRSFDHYFGKLHFQGQPAAEPEPLDAKNPNPLGGRPIHAYHKHRYCEVADLDHSWNGAHHEYDHGRMDGFTRANRVSADPSGRRTMGYYTKRDLPFYYALYRKFAIGDRYFSSVLSQTFPNRFYLLAGTSFGHIRNDFPANANQFRRKTIFQELDRHHVTWKIYYAQVPFAFEFKYVRDHQAGHVFPIQRYYDDAKAGKLPQVVFIDPIFEGPTNVENDEHPPSNVQVGERFAAKIIRMLFRSPDWKSSALFLTYDENGGFYDHVRPPRAPRPDNIPPNLQKGDVKAGFGRYGFRVPMVAISPYSRRHFVSHAVYDHTSILKSIETRFELPPLTNRDRLARPLWGLFDFRHPSVLTHPRLPRAPLDPKQVRVCLTAPPNDGF